MHHGGFAPYSMRLRGSADWGRPKKLKKKIDA